MAKALWILVLLVAVALVRGQPDPCVEYCDLIPENRDLCPEPDPPTTDPPNPPANRVYTAQQVADLRASMANSAHTNQTTRLAAYLVYEGSYYGGGVTEHDRRMQWVSGFSGSSGSVVITLESGMVPNRSALWTDGRYFIQADQEMDCNWIMMEEGQPGTPTGPEWLVDVLPVGALVGADPAYMDTTTWQAYQEAFAESSKNLNLVQVPEDLFVHVWTEENGRPPITNNEIYVHDMTYAGKSWQDKVADAQEAIEGVATVYIVTLLDDIAWMFNLRGSDRETSPLFDSVGMLFDAGKSSEIRLYLRDMSTLLTPAIQAHLNTNSDGTCDGKMPPCVTVMEYGNVLSDIEAFQSDNSITSIWINIGVSYSFFLAAGSKRHEDYSPIQLPKSQKNSVEQQKYRDCQLRDSAHLVEFMAMMEPEVASGTWSEIRVSDVLRSYRARDPAFRMESFFTIAAVGTNGAIIHYRPSNVTDKTLTTNEMFLLDSGGNYLDGTTDVTRTFHFGTPTDKEMEAYTLVLMGVIDLATTVWPFGWKGSDIDARTRTPIWQNGWDFNHGTGHGIGYFLNVHEGPGRISITKSSSNGVRPLHKHQYYSDGPGRINIGYDPTREALHKHMFFSDEPGVYLENEFGVRLETIVEVVHANTTYNFDNKEFLTFDPVTFVPFEPRLIKTELLDIHHIEWLNWYHTRCEEMTGQYLLNVANNQAAYDWLTARTAPIPVPNTTGGASARDVTVWLLLLVACLSLIG